MKKSLIAIVLLAGSLSARAENWAVDLSKGSGSVEFKAVGRPAMLKIVGKGSKPKGRFEVQSGKVSGMATFDLKSLDTGIGLRDKHMKEKYLEVSKHPEASLEITRIDLPAKAAGGDFSENAPFEGKLTVHGVTQPVKGTAKVVKSNGKISAEVEFGIKMKSFNIDVPTYAGITVAEDVAIRVEFTSPVTSNSSGRQVASQRNK
jgi:polyisoprenoid-binding protein YceI